MHITEGLEAAGQAAKTFKKNFKKGIDKREWI